MPQYSIGLPAHQMPKEGLYREFVEPPEGYQLLAADVNQQETGLIADYSQDVKLLELWHGKINIHANTASDISKMSYSDIMSGKEDTGTKAFKNYKAGKVTDLGKTYRMGHKGYDDYKTGLHHYATLYKNAHEKWELTPTEEEVRHWGDTWVQSYKGVPKQWTKFINLARTKGYAETLAGNRFYIDMWGKYRWASESSAIMVPVQGSGADMKYLALAVVRHTFPELIFFKDIHDEIIYCISLNLDVIEMGARLKHCLDNLPYFEAWGWQPTIDFTWSVSFGPNWGSLKEIKI